jgi:hypothetical protein
MTDKRTLGDAAPTAGFFKDQIISVTNDAGLKVKAVIVSNPKNYSFRVREEEGGMQAKVTFAGSNKNYKRMTPAGEVVLRNVQVTDWSEATA